MIEPRGNRTTKRTTPLTHGSGSGSGSGGSSSGNGSGGGGNLTGNFNLKRGLTSPGLQNTRSGVASLGNGANSKNLYSGLGTNSSGGGNSNGDSHPLREAWVFWWMHRVPGAKIDDYESAVKKIATMTTVCL